MGFAAPLQRERTVKRKTRAGRQVEPTQLLLGNLRSSKNQKEREFSVHVVDRHELAVIT
jgi:hypothetical protein